MNDLPHRLADTNIWNRPEAYSDMREPVHVDSRDLFGMSGRDLFVCICCAAFIGFALAVTL